MEISLPWGYTYASVLPAAGRGLLRMLCSRYQPTASLCYCMQLAADCCTRPHLLSFLSLLCPSPPSF